MLIEDIRNGSEKAFKILYSQWISRLYQFVYQYLKSESATDDVVYRKLSCASGPTEKVLILNIRSNHICLLLHITAF